MMESFWGMLMTGPRMFAGWWNVLKEHGCPCPECSNARANGKPTRDGHYCPCKACQKAREERDA